MEAYMEEKSRMDVIRVLSNNELAALEKTSANKTIHFLSTRMSRYNAYTSLGLLKSIKFLEGFLVSKGHEDGDEFHCITSEGIIFIFNENTQRLVTIKGARGGQLKRYYLSLGMKTPEYMKPIIANAYIREKTNPIHNL